MSHLPTAGRLASLVAAMALIAPGAASAKPKRPEPPLTMSTLRGPEQPVVEAAGGAYFVADVERESVTTKVLLRTDGTAAGSLPVLAADGTRVGQAEALTAAGRFLYFTVAGRVLWRTDGTAAGTGPVGAAASTAGFAEPIGARGATLLLRSGSTVLTVDDAGTMRELYRGAAGTTATLLTSTPDGSTYLVLWRDAGKQLVRIGPDGTATTLSDVVADVFERSYGTFGVVGNLVYFTGTDAAHGTEPWVTDGTPAGTHLVQDLSPGPASSSLGFLGDGRLALAVARGAVDTRVYRLAPTSATAITVEDGSVAKELSLFAPAGETTFLSFRSAYAGQTQQTIGPDATIGPVTSLPRDDGPAFGHRGAVYYSEVGGNRILRFSGTGQPVVLATAQRQTNPREVGPLATAFGAAQDLVYFTAGQDGLQRLWRTDGTPAGTFPIIPAATKTALRVDLAGLDRGGEPLYVSGLVVFPSRARARCNGFVTIKLRRDGRVRRVHYARVEWSGTACKFDDAFSEEAFRREGRYTVRASFGRGKHPTTSKVLRVTT